jgi:hypothetical protein
MAFGAVFSWLKTTRALISCCELSHRFELDHICCGVFDAVNVGPRVQRPTWCVVIEARTDTKLILVAGKTLKEPIVQYAPFVMNNKEETCQALTDFREVRLGELA